MDIKVIGRIYIHLCVYIKSVVLIASVMHMLYKIKYVYIYFTMIYYVS